MPGPISDGPSVSLSFANNFWGKEDAGVQPLLERMHNAKVTCDELKTFYTARATMEDEYSRKLLALSRKSLGSQEAGTLRASLDVMRGEVESMGKAHQNIAGQMKSELEEPLAAFSGGMKERRKIVQNGIEKLLKLKIQQAQIVNKTRDRFEQDCLRIKGYLAQGHMVMGQEERKNKAKLEKTQIQVAASNTEYENAVKALEETTGRWNRDWKSACDKFQDLEEERLDFMKSSLWSFANIASTVCVSDDASCEKIRLALENCEVEKDISTFIRDRGTGQEIPDPPKYINFCRGDLNDSQSEASEDESYSVAQFQRTINPAFRSSSPQPSTYESHHDPDSALAMQMSHKEPQPHTPPSRDTTVTPQKVLQQASRTAQLDYQPVQPVNQPAQLEFQKNSKPALPDYQIVSKPTQLDYQRKQPVQLDYNQVQKHGQLQPVPHNEYPPDGMTMYCRTGPPSERSSAASPARPSSRDSQSEYSNPTSLSSQEPPSGKQSPIKYGNGAMVAATREEDKQVQKKKSGFFQSHSPFRRKSRSERDSRAREQQQQQPAIMPPPATRNTWSPASARNAASTTGSPTRRSQMYGRGKESQAIVLGGDRQSGSPEPVDPRASFQLNVGNNVFDVATPDKKKGEKSTPDDNQGELDPIAQALAELKGVTKQSSIRISADRYHGLTTPAPPGTPGVVGIPTPMANGALSAAQRGTPPPSYEQPIKRLDLPQPAFTSAQMQQTRKKYVDQTQHMLTGPPAIKDSPGSRQYDGHSQSRPGTRGNSSGNQEVVRAASPLPTRSISPRPSVFGDQRHRSASPSPYGNSSQSHPVSVSPTKRGSDQGYYGRQSSPGDTNRAASPQPSFRQEQRRPSSSSMHEMQLQLAPGPEEGYGGSQRGRGSGNTRPVSYYGGGQVQLRESYGAPQQQGGRVRSKSIAESRQFTRDGRPILHYSRAMYMYQAAIPEELSFAKGDILAVLRLQDDGWWEAEIVGKRTRPGLVPSNYLQNCQG